MNNCFDDINGLNETEESSSEDKDYGDDDNSEAGDERDYNIVDYISVSGIHFDCSNEGYGHGEGDVGDSTSETTNKE